MFILVTAATSIGVVVFISSQGIGFLILVAAGAFAGRSFAILDNSATMLHSTRSSSSSDGKNTVFATATNAFEASMFFKSSVVVVVVVGSRLGFLGAAEGTARILISKLQRVGAATRRSRLGATVATVAFSCC